MPTNPCHPGRLHPVPTSKTRGRLRTQFSRAQALRALFSRAVPSALIAACIGLAGCAGTVPQSTKEPAFAARYGSFTYAEIEVVRQSEPKSCGLAALACVLTYWEKPATEAGLLARHPVRSGLGHSLQTLQAIAQEQGLLAFAVSFQPGRSGSPAAQLSQQLAKGRPVIAAVKLPQGRYFSDPVPVIGTLDARTVRPFGLVPASGGQEYKLHYVVVIGEAQDRYLLMDPAYGIVSVPAASLLPWWKDMGFAALLCSPAPAGSPSSASSPTTP